MVVEKLLQRWWYWRKSYNNDDDDGGEATEEPTTFRRDSCGNSYRGGATMMVTNLIRFGSLPQTIPCKILRSTVSEYHYREVLYIERFTIH